MPKIRLEGTIQQKIDRVAQLYRQKDADLFSAEAAMIDLRAGIDVAEVMCRDFGPDEYKPLGYIPDEPDTRPGEITWVTQPPPTFAEVQARNAEFAQIQREGIARMSQAFGLIAAPLRNTEQDLKAEKERAEYEEELRKAQGIRPVRRFSFDEPDAA